MAQKILEKMLPNSIIKSRGINARITEPMSLYAQTVLKEKGYSTEHEAICYEKDDSDYILCMEQHHLDHVRSTKAELLGNGIPDPYGKSLEVYFDTFLSIEQALTYWFSQHFFAKEA
jgi:protein-tyrosine-phosphatase